MKAEQIEKGPIGHNPHRSGSQKFLKKMAKRWLRREGKRLLDDAPKKYSYAGYEY